MRVLSTALIALVIGGAAYAESNLRHPDIGDNTPNTLLSKEITGLPDKERDAWIHGGIIMMIQTAATQPTGAARCIMDWYFDASETHSVILETMEKFPDERASSVMFALGQAACDVL